MKLKLFTLTVISLFAAQTWAQTLLYNDGAIVKIQAGATLYVEGGVHNTAAGTIDNDGTLEVKGNLTNLGTWDPTGANTLKFSGNANSDVTSGTALFHTVVVQKDATFNVNLLDNMTVNNNLDFNAAGSTRVTTDNFDLKLGTAATVTGYDSDEYVATTGTGMMQKDVTGAGTFEFPIGDLTNYSPLSSTHSGTYGAAANIRARVNDLTHPNKPSDASDFISRYWDVNATDITGSYLNTLTGTYIPADVTGTASLVKGAVYDGTVWSYDAAAAGTNTVTGSTNDLAADFTGTNFFGKVNILAFLQGPYQTGSMTMTTSLNTAGLIPLTSPYDASISVASIPANVTDWVKIELRDATTPSTILGTGSAFIKNDGSIVGLDGTSLPTVKNGNASSIVAIGHRNHLPFRTNVGLDVVNPTLEDFTNTNPKLYDNGTGNAPLNTLSGRLAMWSCDVSGTTFLLNSADVLVAKQLTATPFTGYSRADVNLNTLGNSADVLITKQLTAVPKSADL